MNEKRALPPPTSLDDPLIRGLTTSIRYAVRILMALMALMALVGWRMWFTCCTNASPTISW